MLKLDWGSIDERTFELLCDDTMRALLPPERRGAYVATHMEHHRDFQRDGVIECGGLPYFNLESPVVVSCKRVDVNQKPGDASKAVTKLFLDPRRFNVLLEQKPRSVVLFTNVDVTEIDKDRMREKAVGRFRIDFRGRSELESLFVQHPHLLWKYFGQTWALKILDSSDHNGLQRELIFDLLDQRVPVGTVRHELVRGLDLRTARRIRIVGKPGAGKSVALWQVLTSMPETDVVVITNLAEPVVWPLLKELLAQPDPRLAFVVDNLHDKLGLEGRASLLDALCSHPGPNVRVILSYRSTERRLVEDKLTFEGFWRKHGFVEIPLDDPPKTYIAAVFDLARKSLMVEMEDDLAQSFVDGIADWENTPACAVSCLIPYKGTRMAGKDFFPADLRARETYWQRAFLGLGGSQADLLRSVSVLRESGLRRVSERTLSDVYTHLTGRASGEFDTAMKDLHEQGWLRRGDGQVAGHDIQVTADVVCLFEQNQPSQFLEKFRLALQNSQLSVLADRRREAVLRLCQLYWHKDRIDIAKEMSEALLLSDSKDIRALCNRGVCSIRLGEEAQGLADLRAAAALAPDDLEAFEKLYMALFRLNRKGEARRRLDARLQRSPNDTELLRFALAHYWTRGQELELARRLWRLKKDASSAAALADVLRASGKKALALRLLNAAIRRWPDSGRLHGVACEHLRPEGRMQEALEHAKKAVTLSPNAPESYVILAWLHVQLGDFKSAEDAIKVGRDLMPRYPAIRAVDGMILLEQGKLEESERELRAALDEHERLPQELICNVHLSLADVLVQKGKAKEASAAFAEAEKHGVERAFCRLREARALREAKRYPEAARVLRGITRDRRHGQQASLDMAKAYSAGGNWMKAVRVLRRAAASEPDDHVVRRALAAELTDAGKHHLALAAVEESLGLKPDDVEALELKGAVLAKQRQHENAVRVFDAALAIRPNLSSVVSRKAGSLMRLEKWAAAAECFRQYRDMLSGAVVAPEEVICLRESGRYDEALLLLDAIIAKYPDDVFAYRERAKILGIQGAHSRSLDAYDTALRLDPGARTAWLGRAEALKAMERFDEAAQSLSRAHRISASYEIVVPMQTDNQRAGLAELREATLLGEELLKAAPSSTAVMLAMAHLRLANGWLWEAAQLCDKVLASTQSYEAALLKARAFNAMAHMRGDSDAIERARSLALQAAELSTRLNPAEAAAHLQLVAAYAAVGKCDEALRVFSSVRTSATAEADDWATAGFALGNVGHPAEALSAFDRALNIKPDVPRVLGWKAQALLELGRTADARQVLDKALALSPHDLLLPRQSALLWLVLKDQQNAVKECRRALRPFPKNAELHELLAVTTTDKSESKKHFLRAIALEPDRLSSLRELAKLEGCAGDFMAAAEHLSRAVTLAPADADTRVIYAQVLVSLGRHADARSEYEAAIRMSPQPFVRHLFALLLDSMDDSEGARTQRNEAVKALGDDGSEHEQMVLKLEKGGLFDSAEVHSMRLAELAPSNIDYLRVHANHLSYLGRHEEADRQYQDALKLDGASFRVHGDYAAHLLKCDRKKEAEEHLIRAWNAAVSLPEKDLDVLVNLANVALALNLSYIDVPVLEVLLSASKGKAAELYNWTADLALKGERALLAQAAEQNCRPDVASLCHWYAGRLMKARGDATAALAEFRAAAGVPPEDRVVDALVAWGDLLVEDSEHSTPDALKAEVNEALRAVDENVGLQDTEGDEKEKLASLRARLKSLQDTIVGGTKP